MGMFVPWLVFSAVTRATSQLQKAAKSLYQNGTLYQNDSGRKLYISLGSFP